MADVQMSTREPRPVAIPVSMEVPREAVPARALSPATERAEAGEVWIARLLRGGALCSGLLFLVSIGLEFLPETESVHVLIDVLRKGAACALLVTPVVRLVVAGTTLGMRGEWRYALYAAGVLGLLAMAVGSGLHA
ncbi:hypothetical protein [Archangium primigenium]|uniref:hypothetical protein n=1 Tax=[Archangium] primigenium TaxID=2792470 RepID=UPI003B848D8D